MNRIVAAWRRLPGWAFGPLVMAFFVLCGITIGLWYRFVTSGLSRPELVETCALGSYDVEGFRSLIGRVAREGGKGGGGCGRADQPGDCLERVLKERIDNVQKVAGPDMLGRIMAMHALMRANKAVLLSQATVAAPEPIRFQVFKAYRQAFPERNQPPAQPRAERFVYALDKREVGLPGPSLIGGGRRTTWDSGQTSSPSGLYAIAEVTIVLSDPALSYPDDSATGAVKEEIGYVAAAWSHRRSDTNTTRQALPSDSVHDMTSLCPSRPGWLDTPAVSARKPGEPSAEERRRRLFQWADELRKQPGRPVTPP